MIQNEFYAFDNIILYSPSTTVENQFYDDGVIAFITFFIDGMIVKDNMHSVISKR